MIVFDLKERKKKDTFNQIDLLENWSSIPTICEVLFYLLIYQQLDNITGLISSHNLKKNLIGQIFLWQIVTTCKSVVYFYLNLALCLNILVQT